MGTSDESKSESTSSKRILYASLKDGTAEAGLVEAKASGSVSGDAGTASVNGQIDIGRVAAWNRSPEDNSGFDLGVEGIVLRVQGDGSVSSDGDYIGARAKAEGKVLSGEAQTKLLFMVGQDGIYGVDAKAKAGASVFQGKAGGGLTLLGTTADV